MGLLQKDTRKGHRYFLPCISLSLPIEKKLHLLKASIVPLAFRGGVSGKWETLNPVAAQNLPVCPNMPTSEYLFFAFSDVRRARAVDLSAAPQRSLTKSAFQGWSSQINTIHLKHMQYTFKAQKHMQRIMGTVVPHSKSYDFQHLHFPGFLGTCALNELPGTALPLHLW